MNDRETLRHREIEKQEGRETEGSRESRESVRRYFNRDRNRKTVTKVQRRREIEKDRGQGFCNDLGEMDHRDHSHTTDLFHPT